MKIREACEILCHRLADRGIERTPKQVLDFVRVRIYEFKGPLKQAEELSSLITVIGDFLEVPARFEVFARDIEDGTRIGGDA